MTKELGAAIDAGWASAALAHPSFRLKRQAFQRDVVVLLTRSCSRLDLTPTDGVLLQQAARLHFEDLYLARSCEQGSPEAWRVLVRRYEPDLRSVLLRECDPALAEAVTADVLAEIALAPPRGGAQTRIGTYDGTGPLWAWLATIGLRAARRRYRRARELTFDPNLHDTEAGDQSDRDELSHAVPSFVHEVHAAWGRLEAGERLALAWKYRDRLAQRRIAALLGVSEPTVSRLVAAGTAKLRGAVEPVRTRLGTAPRDLWTQLEHALSFFLEISGTPPPPKPD